MHVVIVGSSGVGQLLARWLVSAGHEVAVVDPDRTRCAELDQALGSVSVVGDGADAEVLAAAGANRADILVATTDRDDVNLAACQLAQHRFAVRQTVSLVSSPGHSELFQLLGVDVTIDVNEQIAGRIQERITPRGQVQLLPVSGGDGKVLVSVKIPVGRETNGRLLNDIGFPDGTMVPLVIARDGTAYVPDEAATVHPGDEVVAFTPAQEVELLRGLLAEPESEEG